MTPVTSVAHSLYRIVFRGGSPQRIRYSDALLLAAVLSLLVLAIASQRLTYHQGLVPIGLYLFVCLTGLYLGAALLSRRVPRNRLRVSLLAVLLLMAAAHLLLLAAAPLADRLPYARLGISVAVGCALLLGVRNCLVFALGTGRASASRHTLLFALALASFYGTMYFLLEIVFG